MAPTARHFAFAFPQPHLANLLRQNLYLQASQTFGVRNCLAHVCRKEDFICTLRTREGVQVSRLVRTSAAF